MAKFLEKYVRDPLRTLLAEAPTQLPRLVATMQADSIVLTVDDESVKIDRTPAPPESGRDEMPEDATDQLPDT